MIPAPNPPGMRARHAAPRLTLALRWTAALALSAASLSYMAVWLHFNEPFATTMSEDLGLPRGPLVLPPVRLGFRLHDRAELGGVQVEDVYPGSSAERSGLREGDVIVAVDGHSLATSAAPYLAAYKSARPGDQVELTVERPGQPARLRLTGEFESRPLTDQLGPALRTFDRMLPLFRVVFLAVALPVLLLRIDDPHAWGAALLLISMAGVARAPESYPGLHPRVLAFTLAWKSAGSALLAVFAPPSRPAEETAQFKRALELDPRNATIAFYLGDSYRFHRLYEEAERYYDLSISLAPDQMQGYRGKAENYSNQGLLERARTTLESAPAEKEFFYSHVWLLVERGEGRYQGALDRLAAAPPEVLSERQPGWKELQEGALYRLMNQPERARKPYEDARIILDRAAKDRPEGGAVRGLLAEACAGLGMKAEAIREATKAVEQLSISEDAFWGAGPLFSQLRVYLMMGEDETAIDQIEYMLSIPSWLDVVSLRSDPLFAPLRLHPRFNKLLAARSRG
jgi:tetratricopeptide (TPR) repeat protein